MSRYALTLFSVALIVWCLQNVNGQESAVVHGAPTNNLEPVFLIGKQGREGWSINIDLVPQTNFPAHTWLMVLNRSGARLRLWLTNGTELAATGPSALSESTPTQTTVSNVMAGIHRRDRGSQWWPGGSREAPAGKSMTLSGFDLSSVFNTPFTNDVVLQIAPVIYKVDTNQVTARLVEFPPTKLKLRANGEVQKLE